MWKIIRKHSTTKWKWKRYVPDGDDDGGGDDCDDFDDDGGGNDGSLHFFCQYHTKNKMLMSVIRATRLDSNLETQLSSVKFNKLK